MEGYIQVVISCLRRGYWFITEPTQWGPGTMVSPAREDVLELIELGF
jgi:hypothetical protein